MAKTGCDDDDGDDGGDDDGDGDDVVWGGMIDLKL